MVYRHSSTVEHPNEANGNVNGVQEALEELKIESDKDHEVVLDANKDQKTEIDGEAAQCIWLARVRPEDCENIIRYTILQGKVVKPERQLRGGFDRSKQLASW